jgi:hypothetical protein
MTKEVAERILQHNVGTRTWIDGASGRWYFTKDDDDNTSGRTYETFEALLDDVLNAIGFLNIPDDVEIFDADGDQVFMIVKHKQATPAGGAELSAKGKS